MNSLNRFESNLLKILYGLLGKASSAQTLPLILRASSGGRPKCLSPTCVRLVQDTLSKGCVSLLTKWGGWRNESFLRNEAAKKGRVWERTLPAELGLTFSEATLDLLIWLTHCETGESKASWAPQKRSNITVGDQFFFFLVIQMLKSKLVADRLCGSKVFSENGLICLAFPDLFANAKRKMNPDFGPWVSGAGGAIVEMMQKRLVEFWALAESHKPKISDRRRMLQLGQAQATVLNGFVAVAVDAGRADLLRFMLEMMQQLLTTNRRAANWTQSLQLKGLRVADRTEVYLAALAVPVAAKHLVNQQKQNEGVSFVDDEYEASQLWKANWEALNGQASTRHAAQIVQEVTF